MVRRGWVVLVEAFLVLLLIASISVLFYSYSFDSKKDLYRYLLANDVVEVSVKSSFFGFVKDFDSGSTEGLVSFHTRLSRVLDVECIKFGFEELREVGSCAGKKQFFTASRSVFVGGNWKRYSVVLGFD